jgi:hypothetical protein
MISTPKKNSNFVVKRLADKKFICAFIISALQKVYVHQKLDALFVLLSDARVLIQMMDKLQIQAIPRCLLKRKYEELLPCRRRTQQSLDPDPPE